MKHVWSITIVLIILSILSIFNALSLSILPNGQIDLSEIFTKQVTFIIIGWIIYIAFSKIHYTVFKFPQLNILLYILTIGLLISTLLWGPLINNTQRWLIFGEFQFQPSELAKVVMILITSSIFHFRKKMNNWHLMIISFVLLIPIITIVYMQPHGSMSLILLLIWSILMLTIMPNQVRNIILTLIIFSGMGLVLTFFFQSFFYAVFFAIILLTLATFSFYARENWRKLIFIALAIGLVLGVLSSITWNSLLLEYQKERITAFFNPVETSQDLGFNVDQSKVAIGSGQFFGKGWGFGTQSKLKFLPEHQTDFVFAAFSEEFGFVGSITLILLYSFIIFRILVFSLQYTNFDFEFVFLTGIAIKIFLEVFINIATNTGVIPATGIPLPIMSYGGTSILFTFFSLALVQSIIGHTIVNIKENSTYYVDN